MKTTVIFLLLSSVSFCAITYDGSRFVVDEDSLLLVDDVWGGVTYMYDQSTIKVTDQGRVLNHLECRDESSMIMDGGVIESRAYFEGHSTASITGGQFNHSIMTWDDSTVSISNTALNCELYICINSVVEIFGAVFLFDEEVIFSKEFTSISGHYYSEPARTLQGLTPDGDLIDITFFIGDNAKLIVNPVPEPLTILLLGLGGLLIRKR